MAMQLTFQLGNRNKNKPDPNVCNTGMIKIWDDNFIEMLSENRWKCWWCNKVFNNKNSTRATTHVLKEPLYFAEKADIEYCKVEFPDNYVEHYQQFAEKQRAKRGFQKKEILTWKFVYSTICPT